MAALFYIVIEGKPIFNHSVWFIIYIVCDYGPLMTYNQFTDTYGVNMLSSFI